MYSLSSYVPTTDPSKRCNTSPTTVISVPFSTGIVLLFVAMLDAKVSAYAACSASDRTLA